MPRPRPPHLQREITRHGKSVWYVRVNHGPRVRIEAEYGTPQFDAEYRAALAGAPHEKARAVPRLVAMATRPLSGNRRLDPRYRPQRAANVRTSLRA